jgi:hypothetical protein
MLFDFDTLTINKLVVEAAEIVEKLVGNDAFFLHTFGSVLRLIAGEYLIVKSNITDEDILQIRTNLKCTVSYAMEPPRTSYMEFDPGMPGTPSDIIMNPSVRSRAVTKTFFISFTFSFIQWLGSVLSTELSGSQRKRKQRHDRDFGLERRKHLLLFVIKLLHELQHIATWLLFNLFPEIAASAPPQPESPPQSGCVHAS